MGRDEGLIDRIRGWIDTVSSLLTILTVVPGAVIIVASGILVYLGLNVSFWWFTALSGITGIATGFLIGFIARGKFSSKRNAPMGYRIEKTTHDFRMDASDPKTFHRTLSRMIVAKRNRLYAIDGRMKTDADVVTLQKKSDVEVVFPEGRAGSNRLVHYLAIFNPELEKGDRREVEITQKFEYNHHPCDAEYVHNSVVWSQKVAFCLQIPPHYTTPRSFHFSEVKGDGLGASSRRDITHLLNIDAASGIINAEIRNPKFSRRYMITWQWSDDYKKIYL